MDVLISLKDYFMVGDVAFERIECENFLVRVFLLCGDLWKNLKMRKVYDEDGRVCKMVVVRFGFFRSAEKLSGCVD